MTTMIEEAKKTDFFCERCERKGIKVKATTLTNHYLIGNVAWLCDNCIKAIRKENNKGNRVVSSG